MLTYCHTPAHSCSWLTPCEDRALTIRGFPRLAPGREGCKGFYRADPSPILPSMGGSGYNRQHRASPSPHRGWDARRAEGGLQGDGELTTDYHRFCYKCALCAHYLALSCTISRYLAPCQFCAVSLQQRTEKRETIHPLRFARRPCLRGTVSYNRLVATPITSNL